VPTHHLPLATGRASDSALAVDYMRVILVSASIALYCTVNLRSKTATYAVSDVRIETRANFLRRFLPRDAAMLARSWES